MQSKGLSRVFSNTTVQKLIPRSLAQFFKLWYNYELYLLRWEETQGVIKEGSLEGVTPKLNVKDE